MAINVREVDLENNIVQLLVSEAVRMAMASPLREPILTAVEQSMDDEVIEEVAHHETGGTGKSGGIVKGLVAFLALATVAYISLKRMGGGQSV